MTLAAGHKGVAGLTGDTAVTGNAGVGHVDPDASMR